MPANVLTPVLLDLRKSCADIEASALTTRDGLLLASSLPVCAGHRWATLLGLSGNLAENMLHGSLEQVLIKSQAGYVMVTHAGSNALLTVLAGALVEPELMYQKVRQSADRAAQLIAKNLQWV